MKGKLRSCEQSALHSLVRLAISFNLFLNLFCTEIEALEHDNDSQQVRAIG